MHYTYYQNIAFSHLDLAEKLFIWHYAIINHSVIPDKNKETKHMLSYLHKYKIHFDFAGDKNIYKVTKHEEEKLATFQTFPDLNFCW
jgi:hypothetical protein